MQAAAKAPDKAGAMKGAVGQDLTKGAGNATDANRVTPLGR